MLKLYVRVRNPVPINTFKNIWGKEGRITRKKYYSLELMRVPDTLFELQVDLNFAGSDHAGPSVEINLLGYSLTAKIYDVRHWDYKHGKWENR
jgi:hypothetical protein